MKFNSEQEKFWGTTYAEDYIDKNNRFDHALGAVGWEKMLVSIDKANIRSYLECGCNIGRNLVQLKSVLPRARPSVIEISKPAFDYVTNNHDLVSAFNGSILDSNFVDGDFDLVFTMGVLIHVNPDHLLRCMEKMYNYSNKYILIGEYFNRTPMSIEYQGEKDRLFKMDFGKLFIQNFKVKLLDYGFLWGHLFDAAGFDDITWHLFEKD
jgi:pseudaminic acid biosynthesis-associated methylase